MGESQRPAPLRAPEHAFVSAWNDLSISSSLTTIQHRTSMKRTETD
jgi:hypothetical protein